MLPPWLPPVLVAPVIGSFLGVLVDRLPVGRPVALVRSSCIHCERILGPAEMVPIVSYLVQRGTCRGCGRAIAPYHLGVEIAALAIAVWAALVSPDLPHLWGNCVLGWTLLALAWIDWRTLLLPDVLTLPLLVVGLIATAWLEVESLTDHAIAAVLGYVGVAFFAIGYRHLRGKEGLGLGDAKLLAAGGAWLGTAALPWAVTAAAMSGIAMAISWRASGTAIDRHTALPFGPPLALAIWLLRLYSGV